MAEERFSFMSASKDPNVENFAIQMHGVWRGIRFQKTGEMPLAWAVAPDEVKQRWYDRAQDIIVDEDAREDAAS